MTRHGRYSLEDIDRCAPSRATMDGLRRSRDARDRALWLALVSLERIAGADTPEGDAPDVDALRNLNRCKIMLDPQMVRTRSRVEAVAARLYETHESIRTEEAARAEAEELLAVADHAELPGGTPPSVERVAALETALRVLVRQNDSIDGAVGDVADEAGERVAAIAREVLER